jgi:hypothetical protein
MDKYVVISSFSFPNDFDTKLSDINVKKDSIWLKTGCSYVEDNVHLISEDYLNWLDISQDMFNKYFRKL